MIESRLAVIKDYMFVSASVAEEELKQDSGPDAPNRRLPSLQLRSLPDAILEFDTPANK